MTTLFTEDFESGDLSAWTDVGAVAPSYCSVVTTSPYTGSYCAECHDEASSVYVLRKLVASSYPTEYWFRQHFNITEATGDAGEWFSLALCKNEANTSGFWLLAELLDAGNTRLYVEYGDDNHSWANRVRFTPAEDVLIDTNTWHSLEAHLKLDDGAGIIHVFLDGLSVLEITGLDNDQVGDLNRFYMTAVTPTGTQTTCYDNIVVATERIGPLRGYRVYHNAGEGRIDYATVRETLSDAADAWTSDALSYPATWRFGLRAYNEYGEEMNVNVADEVVLLASGEESSPRPNKPAGLGATPAADGKVTIAWSYDAVGADAQCSHFHIFHDSGTGEVDFTTPIGSVDLDADGGTLTHYTFESNALDDGVTYRFAVRAVTADEIEDTNTEWVEATADATAPTQPASLSGDVVR